MTKAVAIALALFLAISVTACSKIGRPYGQPIPIDNQDQSDDEDAPSGDDAE